MKPGPSWREHRDRTHLFEGLSGQQAEAVTHSDGPLLVVTGPRSGKARVLTHRIANFVSDDVAPWRILALPFTNKAATEMRHRVGQLVAEDQASDLWVSTFHRVCRWPVWPSAVMVLGVPGAYVSSGVSLPARLGVSVRGASEGFPMPWSFTARRRQASAPSTSDVGTAALVFSASKSSSSPHLPSLRPSSTYFSAGPPVVGDDHSRWVSGPSVKMVKSMGGPGRLSRRNRPIRNRPKPVPPRNRSSPPRSLEPRPDSPSPTAAATPAAAASVPGSVRKLPPESSSWIGG